MSSFRRPSLLAVGPALGLTSAAVLVLEISLTRVFSVVMWYHFAFFTISVALFGFAAAGLAVHLLPRVFRPERALAAAFAVAMAFAVGVPLFFKLFTINEAQTFLQGILFRAPGALAPGAVLREHGAPSALGRLLGLAFLYLCAVLPFFLGGLVIAIVLRRFGDEASRLYFFDLVGAGLGCLLTVPLLDALGGPGTMVAVAALAAAGAVLYAAAMGSRGRLAAAGALLLLLGVALAGDPGRWLSLRYYRGQTQRNVDYEDWNSFSRVAVRRFAGTDSLLIGIDAASNTFITHWDGGPESLEPFRRDLIAAQYVLVDRPRVLSIGTGGGADILAALAWGAREVTAVEVNPIIVDVMTGRYADYSGGVYLRPEVEVVTDEARSHIRRSRERYDVIQAGYVDTYAATAAGAFALTENTLYTKEAFEDYLDHLTPGGVVSFQRYYEERPQQGIRLVSVALAALRERGAADPARHIAVLRAGKRASVLVKARPLTAAEVDRLAEHCRRTGLQLVAAPGRHGDDLYGALLSAPDPRTVIDSYDLDISPSTDDRPFFFYVVKPTAFWRGLLLRSGEFQHSRAIFLLVSLLGIVAVLSLAVVLLPALRDRRLAGGGAVPAMGYFAALGLGFMLVEIGMLQRLMLYLGHPTLSLSVVLCSLLISAGLGSRATAGVDLAGSARALHRLLAGVLAVIAVVAFVWPWLFGLTIHLARTGRIAVAVLTLLPVGFLMGTAFPLGLRRLAATRAAAIPWAWAVNGATSVLGSVLAMVLAINSGFTVTLVTGALCYLAALALAGRTAVGGPAAAAGAAAADRS